MITVKRNDYTKLESMFIEVSYIKEEIPNNVKNLLSITKTASAVSELQKISTVIKDLMSQYTDTIKEFEFEVKDINNATVKELEKQRDAVINVLSQYEEEFKEFSPESIIPKKVIDFIDRNQPSLVFIHIDLVYHVYIMQELRRMYPQMNIVIGNHASFMNHTFDSKAITGTLLVYENFRMMYSL